MTIDNQKIMRRVAGYHDIRLDGILDLVPRARGAAVLDIGCNRGLVAFEMANNGASVVHGCDNWEPGIRIARELFADMRAVDSKFEVVDLTGGAEAFRQAFGGRRYDIVLMLATYHKLKRVMAESDLADLMQYFGRQTISYFAWRATSDKAKENWQEMKRIDGELAAVEMHRIHTSMISSLGIAAIWSRQTAI